MKATHCISFILVIIGALNWGIIGLGYWFGHAWDWNVVGMILGSVPSVASIVYVLVGISAIILVCTHKKDCVHCNKGASAPTM